MSPSLCALGQQPALHPDSHRRSDHLGPINTDQVLGGPTLSPRERLRELPGLEFLLGCQGVLRPQGEQP